MDASRPVILFDGVCGLCNRAVQFALRRDRRGVLLFAPLQGETGRSILARHAIDHDDLTTLYVVRGAGSPAESLLSRSTAVAAILRELSGPWPALGRLLGWVPRPLRDLGYRVVARYRYRIFGRQESCFMPTPELRARFLE